MILFSALVSRTMGYTIKRLFPKGVFYCYNFVSSQWTALCGVHRISTVSINCVRDKWLKILVSDLASFFTKCGSATWYNRCTFPANSAGHPIPTGVFQMHRLKKPSTQLLPGDNQITGQLQLHNLKSNMQEKSNLMLISMINSHPFPKVQIFLPVLSPFSYCPYKNDQWYHIN